jgi:hypothetical protein
MTPNFGSSDAAVAADQIQFWLADCTKNHKSGVCSATSAPQPLPIRLLEIRGPKQVRLYTPSPGETACYVCLSHCWGGNVKLKTTSKTKEGFEKQIAWEDIPRTFRHAIDMTWRLGLKYIWIDSLCIVQDDIEDWRREGSNMASIYSRAYLTLAATSSTNCEGGFYTPNTSVTQIPDHGSLLSHPVYVRQSVNHRPFFENKLPLMSRAWVFQERMLSPRTVQFTSQELVWECTTTQTCECGACSEDEWASQNKSQYDWLPISDPPPQQAQRMKHQWYNVVNTYTNLNLTFRKDIFPALQGVTKRMQVARKSTCLAGIWEDSLPADILWSCATPSSSATKETAYWAPSWSWASHQGAVSWPPKPNSLTKVSIEVVHVSVTPAGDDPTGELVAAEIVLRGRLKSVSVDNSRPLFPWVVPLRDGYPDTSIVGEEMELMCPVVRKTNDGRTRYWHKFDMDVGLESPFEVLLLLVGEEASFTFCLVLREKDQREDGGVRTFERVGVAWFRGRLDWFGDVEMERVRIV